MVLCHDTLRIYWGSLKGEVREYFEWSDTAAKTREAFLAHKPFLRTKEKHQQNWAIFSNLQKGSCVQKFFWIFFKTVLAGLMKVFTSSYKLHLATPGHWMHNHKNNKYFLLWNPPSSIFPLRYELHHNSHLIKEREL